MTIPVRQMLVQSKNHKIKCPNTMAAEYITVHNTYNDASANNEVQYMINNVNSVSFHFAVDDKEVVQGVPLNRNAWHCGDGGNGTGNRKSIGIEICYSKSGGTKYYQAEGLAIQFIAQLLKERGWGIERVKKHQDWSGKYCPHRILDEGRWNSFLNAIETEMNKKETVKVAEKAQTVSNWAKTSWEKAQKKKGKDGSPIMDGTIPKEPVTREQLAVILDRVGLLE